MKLSAVLTFRDGIKLGYPFLESILSVLPIVDEYLINDGGSTDGSWEILEQLKDQYPDKIHLYQMKDRPSIRWDCVSEQYNHLFTEATGDWVYQGDGDELIHENKVMGFKDALESQPKDALVLRHLRWEVFNWWAETGWYDYWPARTIRNGYNLYQDWKSHGGDEFMLGDERDRWVRDPPRCIKLDNFLIWHFYLQFPYNNIPKRENDAKYIAQGAEKRVEQYLWHVENFDPDKVPEWFGKKVVDGLPALMRHHPGEMSYKIDDRLLDVEYLRGLTGLEY